MFGQRTLLAILILAIPAVSAAQFGDVFVYVAEQPDQCFLETNAYPGQVFSIYVESGDYESVTGVRLRVECERFGPEEVQSVTTPDGMFIAEGDIFTGVTVIFTPRGLHHEPVLHIELAGHDAYGDAVTRDVALVQAGAWEPVPDHYTIGWNFDCFGTSTSWFPPDTVEAAVGRDEAFSFKARVNQGGYPPNGMVSAVDAAGWIPAPVEEWVWAGCGGCLWNYTEVTVPVHIPEGVADGALNPVTFQMLSFGSPIAEKTVVLRAVDPTSTRPTTWGLIKALYR